MRRSAPIIPYGRQWITESDLEAVNNVLQSDFLTQGPAVKKFEDDFAEYVGSKFAVSVNNATAALHLSALVLNVSSGKKVLTTPITFAASSNCVRFCGGDVEFVDIDPVTYNIDLDALEKKLVSSKKGTYVGISPVDFAGLPLDMERLKTIADRHGLWIIEDACHAPGAEFQAKSGKWFRTGSSDFSNLTVFSFHPVKHIACGEGGMITTNDEKLYKHLLKLRSHGIARDPSELIKNDGGWYHEMQELGYNYRLPDILCALGSSQLKKANEGIKRRREIADYYNKELSKLPLILPKVNDHNLQELLLFVRKPILPPN